MRPEAHLHIMKEVYLDSVAKTGQAAQMSSLKMSMDPQVAYSRLKKVCWKL